MSDAPCGPGKFEGQPEWFREAYEGTTFVIEAGSVQYPEGWYGLIPLGDGEACIAHEDSQGFVSLYGQGSHSEMFGLMDSIESDYPEYQE